MDDCYSGYSQHLRMVLDVWGFSTFGGGSVIVLGFSTFEGFLMFKDSQPIGAWS